MDWREIKRAIAQISAKIPRQEPKTGTGFFIGERYVVTALHVVADIDRSPPVFATTIQLDFKFAGHITEASLVEGMWDRTSDWAVLRCDEPPSVAPIVRSKSAARKDDRWESFGYPDIQTEGHVITGEVRDPEARDRGADVLQLFVRDFAGRGGAMYGFSGAPCFVHGAVSGLLRSTLLASVVNGSQQSVLVTEAGAAYACPAEKLVEWQAVKGVRTLPGAWSPSEIIGRDFVVFRSESESTKLEAVIDKIHPHVGELGLGAPYLHSAAAAMRSPEALAAVVPALCKAKVVVFDATGFEPSIMLLAGVRAVVRRGVTILSVGGNYAIGDSLAIPFNVTDANIVAHSNRQDARKPTSVALLAERIRRGLGETESPYYLDMPVFDAVRRLPADRRGIIPSDEGVLVLCPFDPVYTRDRWSKLKLALEDELSVWRKNMKAPPALGVARSFELNSPRLVTHAIYEAIRRVQACVVDLTSWNPNVLFELGVRLAATSGGTACLIEKNWAAKLKRKNVRAQCADIVSLFVTRERVYNPAADWDSEPAFAKAYGRSANLPTSGPSGGALHALIEKSLEIESEPASRPVYRELIDLSTLFAKPPGAAGKSKPTGLYPGNPELPRREEQSECERLLAAWFYLSNSYTKNQIVDDPGLRSATLEIIRILLARHSDKVPVRTRTRLGKMQDILETEVEPHAGNATETDQETKEDATALRNRKEYSRALQKLDEAVSKLEALMNQKDIALNERADIRAELADTLGMKGGIYRRTNELDKALAEYRKGVALEEIDKRSTYNASNLTTLAITLEKASPLEPDIGKSLDRIIEELKVKTQGDRKDEWWALSDLGQFYLLKNDVNHARETYQRAIKTGPVREEYSRHVAILKDLRKATARKAPEVSKNIQSVIVDLADAYGG